jgi:hypothetical protein
MDRSGHQDLPPEAQTRRQAAKGGDHRLHAKTAHDPQRHHQRPEHPGDQLDDTVAPRWRKGRDGGVRTETRRRPRAGVDACPRPLGQLSGHTTTQPSSIEEQADRIWRSSLEAPQASEFNRRGRREDAEIAEGSASLRPLRTSAISAISAVEFGRLRRLNRQQAHMRWPCLTRRRANTFDAFPNGKVRAGIRSPHPLHRGRRPCQARRRGTLVSCRMKTIEGRDEVRRRMLLR